MAPRDRRLLLFCALVSLWLTLLMTGWGPPLVAWLALVASLPLFPWREIVRGGPSATDE